LGNITQVLQTASFRKAAKKLHENQKADLDQAIRLLIESPLLGEQKKGDLAFMRIYKFKMVKQLTLIGYSYADGGVVLELLTFGSHENFYRDAKNLF
jgi:mRNA-degrading endonuclease RelE of RelBE toxin-antitoxin system